MLFRSINGIPSDSRIARGGHLKKEQLTTHKLEVIKKLNHLAKKRNQTLAEMAIAWLLNKEEVTSVIIGASSTQQIQDNINTLHNTSFSTDELTELDLLTKNIEK